MAKKQANVTGHEKLVPYEDLHDSVGSYDGGACLGTHGSWYRENNSCSYRWQAAYRAKNKDRAIYGLGAGRASKSGKSLQQEEDFFTNGTSPWSNQAHHLIPDAALKNAISEVADKDPGAIGNLRKHLLKHKYNLNHWKNMLILPTEVDVGGRLGLPTHKGSHPAYNTMVHQQVTKALRKCKGLAAALKAKEHPNVKYSDVVKALEKISTGLHRRVLALGAEVRARRGNNEKIGINYFCDHLKGALGL